MRLLVSARIAPFGASPRLAARHGLTVVELDGNYHESFAPRCWRGGGSGAQVQAGHGTTPIGSVIVTAAHGAWWHADMVIESDDPKVLERCRVGQPVSIGFNEIDVDDDLRTNVRRYMRAELGHVAILARNESPAYEGAKIVSVTPSRQQPKLAASSRNDDWRSSLPPGWECLLEHGYQPDKGDELLIGRTASHRFDGQRFVPLAAARLAA
jgi:hypothetical protein